MSICIANSSGHLLLLCISPNCPGISGTVTDFFCPSLIPDSFIIVPEVEERCTIEPLVAQVLASLAVYRAFVLIMRLAACRLAIFLAPQPHVHNGKFACKVGVVYGCGLEYKVWLWGGASCP